MKLSWSSSLKVEVIGSCDPDHKYARKEGGAKNAHLCRHTALHLLLNSAACQLHLSFTVVKAGQILLQCSDFLRKASVWLYNNQAKRGTIRFGGLYVVENQTTYYVIFLNTFILTESLIIQTCSFPIATGNVVSLAFHLHQHYSSYWTFDYNTNPTECLLSVHRMSVGTRRDWWCSCDQVECTMICQVSLKTQCGD